MTPTVLKLMAATIDDFSGASLMPGMLNSIWLVAPATTRAATPRAVAIMAERRFSRMAAIRGRTEQVAQARGTDGQHQDDGQHVDYRQEVQDAGGIRQPLEAPDPEHPDQRQAIGKCDQRHAVLDQEGNHNSGGDGAYNQDNGQQGGKDALSPAGDIGDVVHWRIACRRAAEMW
nr:hypothetical protein [Massilia brevitalea]